MQRAAGAPVEPRPVEEDAGPVDHPGAGAGGITEDPLGRRASWCSKRSGSKVSASAAIRRASSSPSSSAPIEQQPWPSSAAGWGRIPRQPRPQMQVQFEVRNESSKRQVVSPSVISVIDGSMGTQRKAETRCTPERETATLAGWPRIKPRDTA